MATCVPLRISLRHWQTKKEGQHWVGSPRGWGGVAGEWARQLGGALNAAWLTAGGLGTELGSHPHAGRVHGSSGPVGSCSSCHNGICGPSLPCHKESYEHKDIRQVVELKTKMEAPMKNDGAGHLTTNRHQGSGQHNRLRCHHSQQHENLLPAWLWIFKTFYLWCPHIFCLL